jgi:queuosine precursor transporter
MRPLPAATAAALLGTVLAANLATTYYGLIPAGFGLLVTAGTYFAGLSLGLRDALQTVGGIRWVLAAIAAGIALSAAFGSGRIALASAVAFGVAELADLAVYTPLRRRNWRTAVAASNAAGAVVDTVLFLTIAGFPLTPQLVGGQLLVKAVWMTLLALVCGEVIARALRREPKYAAGA